MFAISSIPELHWTKWKSFVRHSLASSDDWMPVKMVLEGKKAAGAAQNIVMGNR